MCSIPCGGGILGGGIPGGGNPGGGAEKSGGGTAIMCVCIALTCGGGMELNRGKNMINP